MRFRLVPKSMTLDDLELLLGQIFAEFCSIVSIFGRQPRLNEWRWIHTISDKNVGQWF